MNSSDIISTILGVSLTYDGHANLSAYGYKVKSFDGFYCPWITDLVQDDPKRARVLGIGLAWKGKYYKEIDKKYCEDLLGDWMYRIEHPSFVVEELDISDPKDIKQLIKETSDWAYIVQQVNAGRIHPVTFCYINALTRASADWKSIRWKFIKRKFEIIEHIVDVPNPRVVQLSRFLVKHFKENEHERNSVEVPSEEPCQPGFQHQRSQESDQAEGLVVEG